MKTYTEQLQQTKDKALIDIQQASFDNYNKINKQNISGHKVYRDFYQHLRFAKITDNWGPLITDLPIDIVCAIADYINALDKKKP